MRDFIERLSYQAVGAIVLAYLLLVFFGAYFLSELLHKAKLALANRWVLSAISLLALPFLSVWQLVLVIASGPRALYTLVRDGGARWQHR